MGGVPGKSGYPALSFPALDPIREALADALGTLSRTDPDAAVRMLKLGPKSRDEALHNLQLDSGVLLPAMERFTGVLYAETGAATWSEDSRDWSHRHIAVHSALWGLVRAQDAIPAYRLSNDSRLAQRSMKAWWGDSISHALAQCGARWVLDARSEGYRELGLVPEGIASDYLEVVSRDGGRALNHFNKKHKGELVALLAAQRPDIGSRDDFAEWATSQSLDIQLSPGVVTLAV